MSINTEVLIEVYSILKQYIPAKDRQEAADNVMSVVVDMLTDEQLKEFGGSDTQLNKALKEYATDAEDFDDFDDDID